ncbi:hypothetical protein KA012_04230 [Candidatus Woesebacteria bacterium]|nr:hypothetical protein [Candidatus Woesebacteria bacterium]
MITNNQLAARLVLEKTIWAIRSFFDEKNFSEVTVPVLQNAVPLEPTIAPFTSTWKTNEGEQELYLATSPERYLKKMLALGLGNCYAIGHSFRNLESAGRHHHPEFLMLEWYREDADYQQIMTDVEQLLLSSASAVGHTATAPDIEYQGEVLSIQSPFRRVSLAKLFEETLGISYESIATDEQLRSVASQRGYSVTNASWEQLFNQIFLNEIEPHFGKQPFFLTAFPARISPLCKRSAQNHLVADRFELYIAGIELANGNNEESDAGKVSAVFEQERRERTTKGQPAAKIDTVFINALDQLAGLW